MAFLPQWVIGANVTTFSITPCSVDNNGNITANTANSLKGKWQRFNLNPAYEMKEIAASDQFVKSQVPTGFTMQAEIEEIEQLSPNSAISGDISNVLQNALNICRLIQFTVSRNIGGEGLKTWTGYLVISDFKMEGQREEFIDTMTFKLTSVRDGSNNEISLTLT